MNKSLSTIPGILEALPSNKCKNSQKLQELFAEIKMKLSEKDIIDENGDLFGDAVDALNEYMEGIAFNFNVTNSNIPVGAYNAVLSYDLLLNANPREAVRLEEIIIESLCIKNCKDVLVIICNHIKLNKKEGK